MNHSAPPARARGRPRGFDREEALDKALHLFWSRGFEATSISDLTSAMGITPPALYNAFGDKKSLFMQAVDRYEQGAGCFAQEALADEPTAEEAIGRLLHGAVDSFTRPGEPKGCFVVLGATNCTEQSSDIFAALAERREKAEKAVRTRIRAGQMAGELAEEADVEALTGMVTATLYGLAVQAKDGASRSQLHKIVSQTMRAWPGRYTTKKSRGSAVRPSARPRGRTM
jgi:TetR/AcrR family transcriptional regulator, copper-responsive repressor